MQKSVNRALTAIAILALTLGLATSRASAARAGGSGAYQTTSATFYVATTGSDANPGTQSQPWRTIQKAANTLTAGQAAIVLAGVYKENVTISRSGASGAPIVLRGENAPSVVQSNPKNTSCLAAQNSCVLGTVNISGSQVSFKNLEVAGSPVKPGSIPAITVGGSNDLVSGNFVHNSYLNGIFVKASASSDSILNNNIMYAVVSGIYFDGQNHLIQGNKITHSVTRGPDGVAPSAATDPDGIRFFGRGTIVKKNVIKDIYVDESPQVDDPHSDCFQTWTNANNITFDGNYCELENSTTYTNPMEKFFMVAAPSSSTSTVGNIKIINNIFVSKSVKTLWTPIQLGSNACSTAYPLKSFLIANNTFVHTGSVVASFAILMRCANTVTIENNALYNFASSSYRYIYQDKNNNSGVTISNNSVFNSTGATPKGGPYPGDNIAATWMKDPQFVALSSLDLHLSSGSPLVDPGATVSGVGHDRDGNPRPAGAAFDIGAYERVP